MQIIVRLLVAACLVVGFGFHYGVMRLVANAITEEVGQHPQPATLNLPMPRH